MNIKVKVALISAVAVIIAALVNGAFVLFKRDTNKKTQIINSNQTIVIEKGNLINNFGVPQALFDTWEQTLNKQALLIKQIEINIRELANDYANLKSTLKDRPASDVISKQALHQLSQGNLVEAEEILIQDLEDQKLSGNYQMASSRALDISQLKNLHQEPSQGEDYADLAKELQKKHEEESSHTEITEPKDANTLIRDLPDIPDDNTDLSSGQNKKEDIKNSFVSSGRIGGEENAIKSLNNGESFFSVQQLAAAQNENITIKSPTDGARVPARLIVRGVVIDRNVQVWVIVHPVALSSYWIQPPVLIKSDGRWGVKVYIGRVGYQDVGMEYEIMAIADPKQKLVEGDVLGWPKAKWRSDIVTVIRE